MDIRRFIVGCILAGAALWGIFYDNTPEGMARRKIDACARAAEKGVIPNECGTALASSKQKHNATIVVPPTWPYQPK